MGTSVSSAMVETFAMASSKLLAMVPAATPAPVMAVVTGNIFLPRLVDVSPIFPKAFPTFSRVILLCLASSSNLFNDCSVASISRFKARYCSSETSPLLNCSSTWASAVFRTSSFSFVSLMALERSCCFCARASVFLGSSFNSFSTSFSSAWVLFTFPSTPERAFSSFVASPPISIVMPCMLFPPFLAIASAPFPLEILPQALTVRLGLLHTPTVFQIFPALFCPGIFKYHCFTHKEKIGVNLHFLDRVYIHMAIVHHQFFRACKQCVRYLFPFILAWIKGNG